MTTASYQQRYAHISIPHMHNKTVRTCYQLRLLRNRFPGIVLVTDIALDPYSSAGHDGVWHDGTVLNDVTVRIN